VAVVPSRIRSKTFERYEGIDDGREVRMKMQGLTRGRRALMIALAAPMVCAATSTSTTSFQCAVKGQSEYSGGAVEPISETIDVNVSEVDGDTFIYLVGRGINYAIVSRSRTLRSGTTISALDASSPEAWAMTNLSEREGSARYHSVQIDRRTGRLSYRGKFISSGGSNVATSLQGMCKADRDARTL
jgi:hypothetical protein